MLVHKKYIKNSKEVETVTDILCNKCGKTCVSSDSRKVSRNHDPKENAFGLIEQSVHGAYFSTVLDDYVTYTFSLCEPCLMELFKSFELSVQQEEYNL